LHHNPDDVAVIESLQRALLDAARDHQTQIVWPPSAEVATRAAPR